MVLLCVSLPKGSPRFSVKVSRIQRYRSVRKVFDVAPGRLSSEIVCFTMFGSSAYAKHVRVTSMKDEQM